MRKRLYLGITCVAGAFAGVAFAQGGIDCNPTQLWKCYDDNSSPMNIIEEIVDNDDSDIIETQLDVVNNTQIYGIEYKLSGTLESVRQNMSVYLQWIAFIGLAAAVILIIYNGILLITTPLSPDQVSTVKKRMMYISGGIALLTGFYFLLKILLAVYIDIFVK